MISRNLTVAALIAAALQLAVPAPDARAAVQITEANADQRLSQAETAFRAGRRDEAERLLWEVTGWANHLSSPVGFGDDPASTAMAERMYQRVLATTGRTFGAEDEHAWDALMGLANLYRKQRRFAEAESLLRRAVSITQKVAGPVGLRFFAEGTAVGALATLYEEQGRRAEAEAAWRRAADFFDVASPLPSKEKRDEALLQCALMLRSTGRRAAAAELEARMLPENRGKVSQIEAQKAWDAAMAATRAGRTAEAERIYKGVVSDAEARGDPILGQAVSALMLFYIGTHDEAQIRILCERYSTLNDESFCQGVAPRSPGNASSQPPVPERTEQPLSIDTINAGRNPDDPRIRAFVAYLTTQGFTLIHKDGGHWLVSFDLPGWERSVSIRSFPAAATEAQMRGALEKINLAYRLNARAHLAMSYFDYQGSNRDPRSDEPNRKLAELFLQYSP